MDLAKYRSLFLEEATENLAELSRAVLELEKDPTLVEALECAFRMAHSIKGMAASLDYHAISEVAHRLEDRMGGYRSEGGVDEVEGLPLLFRALEGLERMVACVRETGEPPPPDPELVAALSARIGAPEPQRKKVPRRA